MAKPSLVSAILLTAYSLVYAQEPKPAAPAAKPEPDLRTQKELTGNWGGPRSEWKDKGVELEFKFYEFAQGVASGGVDTGAVGNSKFQTEFYIRFWKTR